MEEKILSAAEETVAGAAVHKNVQTPKKKRKWTPEACVALLLAIIPLVGFVVFSGFPLMISIIALFCDVDLYQLGDFIWNAFEGFKVVFSDGYSVATYGPNMAPYFYKAIGITVWVASTQLVTLVIALAISVLLATNPKGRMIFQILYFIPYICSTVAVSLMWRWFFNGETSGVLNTLLGAQIRWLEEPSWMAWCIIVAIIWQAPGYGIVMYKAALANVDSAQYEAASLDGANAWQRFWYITLPGIAPTTFFLLLSGVSAGFLTYDIAALIIPDGWTGYIGGNESMGLTLMRLVYWFIQNEQLTPSTVSAASVISWVLFAVTATLSIILFRRREKSMEG